jgi:hypothetical protein
LKKFCISLFALAFIFSFNLSALADEGHSHDSNIKQATEKFKNGTSTNQAEVSNDHGHTDQTDANHDNTSSTTHTEDPSSEATHEEEGHGTEATHSEQGGSEHEEGSEHKTESEGHHGPVVETPPNYKVLGTYGAVNLSFIMIGVWNKWFRRKGNK